MTPKLAIVGALALSLMAAAPAEGKPALSVTPKSPYVDQDPSLLFRPSKPLTSDYRWIFVVNVRGSGPGCASSAIRTSRSRSGLIRMKLRSDRDGVLDNFSAWCNGLATATVRREHIFNEDIEDIVSRKFRFRAAP